MTDRYAVIGHPVAHSKSPIIHAAFARQTGEDLEYGRILAPRDGFAAAVAQFAKEGGRGLNVTLPFKREAFALAAAVSDRARDAGAVNTLRRDEDAWYGDNTDGVGLLRDLVRNLGVTIAGRDVLVLGAGGSTITQQLAKNLFLSSSRSYWRKGEEAVITVMLEALLDKRRIFELYLNVIEWGNGVFGAEAAAHRYFGTTAARLSAEQAARLAAMAPNPRFYERNPGAPGLNRKIGIILARMRAADIP